VVRRLSVKFFALFLAQKFPTALTPVANRDARTNI
jgi:hypothetical protein